MLKLLRKLAYSTRNKQRWDTCAEYILLFLAYEFRFHYLSKIWVSMTWISSCSWSALFSSSSPDCDLVCNRSTQTKNVTLLTLLEMRLLSQWCRNWSLNRTGVLCHPPGKSPVGSQLSCDLHEYSFKWPRHEKNLNRSLKSTTRYKCTGKEKNFLVTSLVTLLVLLFFTHAAFSLEEVPCVSRTRS